MRNPPILPELPAVLRAPGIRSSIRRRAAWSCLLACLLAGPLHAGSNTDLVSLLDSAGDLTPAFDPAVTAYSQTHDRAELLLWPVATDLEARVEVRANAGAWRQVTAGSVLSLADAHGVLLRANGSVGAWGHAFEGVLPAPPALSDAVSAHAGYAFGMALQKAGSVRVWGARAPEITAWAEPFNGSIASVCANFYDVLTVLQDGTVHAWSYGSAPVPVGLTNIMAVADGNQYTLGLQRDGTLLAWQGTTLTPEFIPADIGNVAAIAAEELYFAALRRDGTVRVWPYPNVNQLPLPPPGLANVTAIATGREHITALKSDGTRAIGLMRGKRLRCLADTKD